MKAHAFHSNAGKASAGSRWRCRVWCVGLPLALLAVVFQLGLLIGHHHFEPSGKDGFGNVSGASILPETGQTGVLPGDSRQGEAPAMPAHKPCFLCLAIHAVASLDAAAPLLMLPVVYERQPLSPPSAAPLMPPTRVAAFDSRGPPRI